MSSGSVVLEPIKTSDPSHRDTHLKPQAATIIIAAECVIRQFKLIVRGQRRYHPVCAHH